MEPFERCNHRLENAGGSVRGWPGEGLIGLWLSGCLSPPLPWAAALEGTPTLCGWQRVPGRPPALGRHVQKLLLEAEPWALWQRTRGCHFPGRKRAPLCSAPQGLPGSGIAEKQRPGRGRLRGRRIPTVLPSLLGQECKERPLPVPGQAWVTWRGSSCLGHPPPAPAPRAFVRRRERPVEIMRGFSMCGCDLSVTVSVRKNGRLSVFSKLLSKAEAPLRGLFFLLHLPCGAFS